MLAGRCGVQSVFHESRRAARAAQKYPAYEFDPDQALRHRRFLQPLQSYFNPLAAMAGKVTIAEAEEIVDAGELDPDQIHTPGIFVQHVLHRMNLIRIKLSGIDDFFSLCNRHFACHCSERIEISRRLSEHQVAQRIGFPSLYA